jgi:hypothetical protein
MEIGFECWILDVEKGEFDDCTEVEIQAAIEYIMSETKNETEK